MESDRVERKESFNGDVPKKARQAICAFANDLPDHREAGVLFIGARDDGEPSGLAVTEQLLLTLADMKSDGRILPLPVMTVERRILKGAEMAIVTVQPSDMPPVRVDGRIWIRTGPRRAVANAQEERILTEKRRYNNLPFDLFPITNANISDLSQKTFEIEYLPAAYARDILEANERSYEERLASCRMVSQPADPVPTVLGILALGIHTQDFLPGAALQFLRIDGTQLVDEVGDELFIGGTVPEQLRRIEEKIAAHNRIRVQITDQGTDVHLLDYPLNALRQIVYNAVLHRTYEGTNAPTHVHWFDDRIEIRSPGGPYGNVTSENFGRPGIVDYWNPNLADVLKTYGFVQKFGRGIIMAQEEMKKNGNPPIEFQTDSNIVLCILRKKQ